MALYLIRRDLGNAVHAEIDAAAIRALSCLYNYEGLEWLDSYWGQGKGQLYCLYEAQTEQQIVDHAAQSRIPCDEITAVQHISPEDYADQVPQAMRP